jgi:hypothetical protein
MNDTLEMRKLVRQIRTAFGKMQTYTTRDLEVFGGHPPVRHPFNGGISDDAEDERRYLNAKSNYDVLTTRLKQTEACWQVLVSVFGKNLVDHAIEEGERRIGNLPYVDE